MWTQAEVLDACKRLKDCYEVATLLNTGTVTLISHNGTYSIVHPHAQTVNYWVGYGVARSFDTLEAFEAFMRRRYHNECRWLLPEIRRVAG